MAMLIFIAVLLAAWHLVYGLVIAPSFHLSLRYKLYELKEELRVLKNKKGKLISDDLFEQTEGAIDWAVEHSSAVSIPIMIKIKKRIESSNELRREADKREKLINDCKVDEIKDISNKTIEYIQKSILINSGGWAVYLLPFIPLILLLVVIKKLEITLRLPISTGQVLLQVERSEWKKFRLTGTGRNPLTGSD